MLQYFLAVQPFGLPVTAFQSKPGALETAKPFIELYLT